MAGGVGWQNRGRVDDVWRTDNSKGAGDSSSKQQHQPPQGRQGAVRVPEESRERNKTPISKRCGRVAACSDARGWRAGCELVASAEKAYDGVEKK